MLPGLTLSVVFALITAAAMVALIGYILFQHDTNHEKFEAWVDFSFTSETLARALDYYRVMAVSMLFTYVMFTIATVWLQWDGFQLFKENGTPVKASPIAVSLFTLDLVLRGGFFDFMQHFDVSLSHIQMNRQVRGYVWYAFIFRMFYGLTMFRILLSFLWIYGKISVNRDMRRRAREDEARQPRMFD
jgi:hypothetical protein